jgi:hypothetical protein
VGFSSFSSSSGAVNFFKPSSAHLSSPTEQVRHCIVPIPFVRRAPARAAQHARTGLRALPIGSSFFLYYVFMQPVTANRLDLSAIPYRQATPGQHAQAVLWVAQQLHNHFPTLSVTELSEAYHRFQPDLWESRAGIDLDYVDLARLTQRLAHSPLTPELNPPIYCVDACYLAEFVDYLKQVADSLRPELEASPLAHNSRLMALIERLAIGNAVAERVLQETYNAPLRATMDPA